MGFNQSIASRFLGINLLRVLIAGIVITGALYSTQAFIKSSEEVNRSQQMLGHALSLRTSTSAMIVNGYGFLSGAGSDFLQTFYTQRDDLDKVFSLYQEGLNARSDKSTTAQELKQSINSWLLDEVDPLIAARQAAEKNLSAAQLPENYLLKDFLPGGLKAKLQLLIATEKRHLAKQKQQLEEAISWGRMVFIGGILMLLLSDFTLSFFAASGITRRIRVLAKAAKRLAKGDLDVDIEVNENDEIGTLALSIKQTVERLKHVEVVVKATAAEDFAKQVHVLGLQDQLALAINKMSDNLKRSALERDNQSWLKSGIADLHFKMRSEHELLPLTQLVITYLANYLNAQVGSFYLREGQQLRLVSSYAFKKRNNNDSVFEFGEGLIGQAALEQQSILYSEMNDEQSPLVINNGLNESSPTDIFVLPLVHEERVEAVLALGVNRKYSQIELEFLERAASSIAISLHVTRTQQKMAALLEESKLQSEELQAQQEELKAANEELEEQSTMLLKSEATLRSKSEELQQINTELEERSEELERQTAETAEKSRVIEQAKQAVEIQAKNLQKASHYKSEFLANMSHELRTPLNSLLILSQSLAKNNDGNLTEEQEEDARVIYEGGKSLLTLINDILDLSKVEAGKMNVNFEPFSIDGLLNSLSNQFNPLANNKGIELHFDKEETLPAEIFSDPQRLEQILRNLLSNGIKFTHQGRVSLQVVQPAASVSFANAALQGRPAIGFAVSDTGIGISAENQDSVFEAFQQGDGSTSRNYGGTGLGLTISRELVKLLGGEIQLHSEEGQGSTFTLYLPLDGRAALSAKQPAESKPALPKAQPAQDAQTPRAGCETAKLEKGESSPEIVANSGQRQNEVKPSAALSPTAKKQESHGFNDDRDILQTGEKSVLVIEDDPAFMRILMDLARKKGYRGLASLTGSEGLQLAEVYQPSAIILDLGLPDISGRQVLEQLKQNIKTRHIPVHILSAEDKNTEVLQMGAIGFLTKPVSGEDVDELFGKLENLLEDGIKRVLLVEDDTNNRLAVTRLIANKEVDICAVGTGREAQEKLLSETFDCVILDLSLPDISGFELLNRLSHNDNLLLPPIVVYTGRELTSDEYKELSEYTSSIVIKGANSPERLLDETTLFLHSIESSLPSEQRNIIKMLHNSEQVLQGRKILLVDDDLRNTYALSKVLREHGLEVILADNGELALEKLDQEEDIELVLMDIMMPVMDGYEAMRRIRLQETFKKLPIIALTAKAMPEDRSKSIAAGANDYCTKPIDVEKLLSMIRVWLFK